ncbi:MAG: hypothetical protein Q8S11_02710, partial [Daejeonella sp.]|uniref:hypothetical protein n=1 Tax=Daejeonella sp. TaxID=2805397 RepID=UPI002733574B
RLLQCLGHPKPPCDLLMLPDVTPVHKGLAPSGDSFLKELYLPFKAHTMDIKRRADNGFRKFRFLSKLSLG